MFKGLVKAEETIGIDLGDSAVKLVQVRKSGTAWQVLDMDMESVRRNGPRPVPSDIAKALETLVRRKHLRKKRVSVSVDPSICAIRELMVPVVPDEELSQIVSWETGKQIEFDDQTHNMDYIIHNREEAESGGKYRVMAVVSKKSDLSRTVSMVESAGLRVRRLGLPADAVRTVMGSNPDVDPEMGTAAIDLGLSSTSLTIMRSGQLRFSRQLSFSLYDVIQAVSEQTGEDDRQAMQLIQDISFVPGETSGEDKDRLLLIVQPVLERLIAEINRSFTFYASVSRGDTVDRAFITGGFAHTAGVESYFLEHLGVMTHILDPFKGMQLMKSPGDRANRYTVALGLGMLP